MAEPTATKLTPEPASLVCSAMIAVSLIAVFEGYDSKPTAEGVSTATTRTVVISSLAILALDFIMTTFMFREAGT